ncbi:MAG: SUMF1/EgtB/PvdO family nonheme iron enzyme [Candidatus Competibacteraceae bacterium]|nr:SUMF1/EgtB/PvdO family nonheme iron enzyme [Candidatus Competibacteraceae bacterium]
MRPASTFRQILPPFATGTGKGASRPSKSTTGSKSLAWTTAVRSAAGANGIPPARQTRPAFWNDDAFNNPAQPVVGVCWYEARAYCAWLSAQAGQPFRLATEAEWEAAARGPLRLRYAYGDEFDATLCNAFETHVRRTTPVGVFPGGETPDELIDLTGNSWDWTGSLYQPYPYVAADGREDPAGLARRVVRGGAWDDDQANARAACRYGSAPGNRGDNVGFRLARASPSETRVTDRRVAALKRAPRASRFFEGATGMIDPALHAGIEFGEADVAIAVGGPAGAQAPGEIAHVASLDAPVGGIDDEPEPGNADCDRGHLRRAGVHRQPQPGQPLDDGLFPVPQLPLCCRRTAQNHRRSAHTPGSAARA